MSKQYYKIGEVSKLLDLKASTIRFWEKEFNQLKPVKSSNQRYYTKKHIDFLQNIKVMLYEEKLTIEGAKKRINDNSIIATNNSEKNNINIKSIKDELLDILEILK